jgi:hypothetical protein
VAACEPWPCCLATSAAATCACMPSGGSQPMPGRLLASNSTRVATCGCKCSASSVSSQHPMVGAVAWTVKAASECECTASPQPKRQQQHTWRRLALFRSDVCSAAQMRAWPWPSGASQRAAPHSEQRVTRAALTVPHTVDLGALQHTRLGHTLVSAGRGSRATKAARDTHTHVRHSHVQPRHRWRGRQAVAAHPL